MAKVIFKIGYG